MSGTSEYDNKIRHAIDTYCSHNETMVPYIHGFSDYLISTASLNTAFSRLQNAVRFLRSNYFPTPEELSLDDYTKYMNKAKNRNPGYANAVYYGLKSLSTYLFISDKCPKDYMDTVKKPKYYDPPEVIAKREQGFLTSEECNDLLSYLYNRCHDQGDTLSWNWVALRDYALVYLVLTTGMRSNALYKLDVSNIDLENCKVTIREKGDKIVNYSFGENVKTALIEYIHARDYALKKRHYESDALFLSRIDYSRLSQITMVQMVKKHVKKVTEKNLSPHKLRATFCTELYNKTKDLYFVQQCMHHSDASTTERYIRTGKDLTEESAKIMDGSFTITEDS